MKKTLYTVQGDWRENDCQCILYQGFDKQLALKAALKYFKKYNGPKSKYGFFADKKGDESYSSCLERLGVEKFLDQFADGYWNTAAIILTRKIDIII